MAAPVATATAASVESKNNATRSLNVARRLDSTLFSIFLSSWNVLDTGMSLRCRRRARNWVTQTQNGLRRHTYTLHARISSRGSLCFWKGKSRTNLEPTRRIRMVKHGSKEVNTTSISVVDSHHFASGWAHVCWCSALQSIKARTQLLHKVHKCYLFGNQKKMSRFWQQ